MTLGNRIEPTQPNLKPLSFRIDERLATELDRRGPLENRNAIARRDLGRYYRQSYYALQSLQLSQGVASLLCDLFNGFLMSEELNATDELSISLSEAISVGELLKKWGVTKDELNPLLAVEPLTAIAILDAIERFWLLTELPTRTALEQAGLVDPSEPHS